jgi:cation diffusion facilitator CzcD-associated flavoprotein CzcO
MLKTQKLRSFCMHHQGKSFDSRRRLHHSSCNRPCYIGLKNNVATRLLETTLNKFPPGTEDFVSHSVLKDYIQDTAAKTAVDALTQYNTDVRNVTKVGSKWAVQTSTLKSHDNGTVTFETSTSVRIASPHMLLILTLIRTSTPSS